MWYALHKSALTAALLLEPELGTMVRETAVEMQVAALGQLRPESFDLTPSLAQFLTVCKHEDLREATARALLRIHGFPPAGGPPEAGTFTQELILEVERQNGDLDRSLDSQVVPAFLNLAHAAD